ncbi:hypothetical protein [Chitinophaga sp. MM2321]|uniref:hypothetical protein n=1 Tax=Chitinophaga sp. MM2321 TaxID=3137178 RepID=UPI0032D57EFB
MRSLHTYLFVLLCWLMSASCADHKEDPYHIDRKGISQEVLENYLKRSVTMAEFLTVDPYCVDASYPAKEDDIRLIENIGAKFIGRAIYRWGKEDVLNETGFLQNAERLVKAVHENDKDVVFEAAVFECITTKVNTIKIPEWTFKALDLPVEDRNFRYDSMLNSKGVFVNHWGAGSSVPDITRSETQLWMMFLAGTYIGIGCEAIHFGQIDLIGMADNNYTQWSAFLDKLRQYAGDHARRNWILLDAHTPHGGMVVNGKSLLDFNAFPLRVKEVPEKPMEGVLEKGYLDAFFGRSKGCITPSGWSTDALPYLVELDNFGVSEKPGVADTTSHYTWGYDEITWFYLQPEAYKKEWLWYAQRWINANDKTGYLEMPVSRLITRGQGLPVVKNRANTPSPAVPDGLNIEETIKEIWQKESR